MITNLTLENFKCFQHVSIEPKLVTVFIGPNGTGKSGVLQALLLLKRSRFDGNGGSGVNLRTHSPTHFMIRESDNPVTWTGYRLSGYWPVSAGSLKSDIEFDVHVEVAFPSDTFQETWGSIRFTHGGRMVSAYTEKGSSEVEVHIDTPGATVSFARGYGMQVIASGSIEDEAGRHDLREACMAPIRSLGSLRFVPAARGLIQQVYGLGKGIVDDLYSEHVLAQPDPWPQAIGRPENDEGRSRQEGVGSLNKQEQDTATTLAYSRTEVDKISTWMEQVTGVGFRAEIVPGPLVRPVSIAPVGIIKLAGEGFGTNALVQLLFELARAESGACVLMEEPEVHLHPKAQAELASVIAGEAKATGKQVIMTTHSEHIAGRLLTMVAAKHLFPEDIAIYSFDKDELGVCSATQIEVTERGQLIGGLRSFFETDLDEMRRYVDALRSQQ